MVIVEEFIVLVCGVIEVVVDVVVKVVSASSWSLARASVEDPVWRVVVELVTIAVVTSLDLSSANFLIDFEFSMQFDPPLVSLTKHKKRSLMVSFSRFQTTSPSVLTTVSSERKFSRNH